MAKIIFVSGPCGCGKSTFTNAYAKHLVDKNRKTVYVIHGDDFHAGLHKADSRRNALSKYKDF